MGNTGSALTTACISLFFRPRRMFFFFFRLNFRTTMQSRPRLLFFPTRLFDQEGRIKLVLVEDLRDLSSGPLLAQPFLYRFLARTDPPPFISLPSNGLRTAIKPIGPGVLGKKPCALAFAGDLFFFLPPRPGLTVIAWIASFFPPLFPSRLFLLSFLGNAFSQIWLTVGTLPPS